MQLKILACQVGNVHRAFLFPLATRCTAFCFAYTKNEIYERSSITSYRTVNNMCGRCRYSRALLPCLRYKDGFRHTGRLTGRFHVGDGFISGMISFGGCFRLAVGFP